MEELFIQSATRAKSATPAETIQSLWSGYGRIVRYKLHPPSPPSVILKHVLPPPSPTSSHTPSHARKLRSYAVETAFYSTYAARAASAGARVPQLFAAEAGAREGERLLLMEDLDAAGFCGRRSPGNIHEDEVLACAQWLARFHASFLTKWRCESEGLWKIGCYWDLSTRAEEFAEMSPGRLKTYAATISARLGSARWQTLVHGDAKLANFCFRSSGSGPVSVADVAAVDFQYTGGGAGVRDVVYLVGSAFGERDLAVRGARVYEGYFKALRAEALESGRVSAAEAEQAAAEWQGLVAWAVGDFQRFLAGWASGHWKVNGHVQEETERVLDECEAEAGSG